jgi:MinD superfamily P-loop ATPase
MAYRILSEECINCGSCQSECPTEAIVEDKDYYRIKSELCNDCGSCKEVCPQECIKGPEKPAELPLIVPKAKKPVIKNAD